jgi:4'-phosphopantetheinyl transferase
MTAGASRPNPDEVRVWHVETAALFATPADEARYASALGPTEQTRYTGYRHDADRRMFLAGRVIARALVGRALGVAPDAWPWREGPRGRPEVAVPDTSVRFNLAHSAGLVACAIASGRDVGVDVEDLDRRPVDPHVVTRYCAPEEVRDIEAHGPRWHDRFLLYWTLKEAYLKARGLGIAVTLADICFAIDDGRPRVTFRGALAGTDDRWTFTLARPTPRHLMAIATSADGDTPAITIARVPADLT